MMTEQQTFGLFLLLIAYSGITLGITILQALAMRRIKKAAQQQPAPLLGVVAPPPTTERKKTRK